VLQRGNNTIQHRRFSELFYYLRPNDILVFNDTAVLPSRLWGILEQGGQVEVTLITNISSDVWKAMIRPAERLRHGGRIFFKGGRLAAKIIKSSLAGMFVIEFSKAPRTIKEELIKIATPNIPFYLKRNVSLREYQTVYARHAGSTQCPTAGLHFQKPVLQALARQGVQIGFITLHIGGSILPLTVDDYKDFSVAKEFFIVSGVIKKKIERARACGGRVIAVGTSVMRALETAATGGGTIVAKRGWTNLTITPHHRFRVADGLLTNFHLPASGHLLLTASFGGIRPVLTAYRQAISRRYNFLDFGDAMLMI